MSRTAAAGATAKVPRTTAAAHETVRGLANRRSPSPTAARRALTDLAPSAADTVPDSSPAATAYPVPVAGRPGVPTGNPKQ